MTTPQKKKVKNVLTRQDICLSEDKAFKYIMKDLSCATYVIQTLIKKKVTNIKPLSPIANALHPEKKTIIFDTLYLVNSKIHVAVEMQNRKTSDILARIETTYHRLCSEAQANGCEHKTPNVFIIWLVNFSWKSTGYGYEFCLQDEYGKKVSRNCKVKIVEIVHIKDLLQVPVKDLSDFDAIRLYLKYGNRKTHQTWLKELVEAKGGIANMETNIDGLLFDPMSYLTFKQDLERRFNDNRAKKAEIRAAKAERGFKEERYQREEAERKQEEERRQREEAERKQEEERRQREEAQRKQEEAQRKQEEYEQIIQLMKQGNRYNDAMAILKSQAQQ